MKWKTAYIESRVLSASPLELVDILYEYAIRFVEAARENMVSGDIEARSRAVSKAMAIIGELEASLDCAAGGEIAMNLARLYKYIQDRLMTANLRQEDGALAEVESLLRTLGQAWKAVSAERLPVTETLPMAAWNAPPAFDIAGAQSENTWSA